MELVYLPTYIPGASVGRYIYHIEIIRFPGNVMNIYCQHLNLASILQVVFVSFFGAMYYFNFWQNSSEPLESEIETSTAVQPTGTLAGALQPIGKDSVWYLEKRKPWIFWGGCCGCGYS